MWDFSIGRSVAIMLRTWPFILFRMIVYFAITAAYIAAIGTGAGIGWGVGHIFADGGPEGTAFYGGIAGFALVSIVVYWLREYILYVLKAGHIAVMALIRHIGYALAGETYDFSHGRLALVLIYESRKDFLTFVLTTGMFWAYERLHRTEAPPPRARIEVRADGRILYLSPDEIVSAEAAGNYVELRLTHGKPLLLRATLADYADRLGPDFVRAHRSRLINRAHIREISVTAAGDPRLTLSDGREVAGSRRYRDRLRL